ncbi:HPr kinase/phosphorylase [Dechloromonas sp. TW-R-39-2]|uniref:HPr(Ser) kinase/phosphatase n=1 Tax=Dechloromonas sp. TW-R-39-2 TaxID=2654218 RepID=UPI00193DE513|nr:HPr(Ser) kinase/phosphatase [Dechloromonas sp. TW-R-39-2]QRM18166.1 HPr kinase/phosphorylase [Dechloromonas sp. TW-R-39-2]
MRHISLTQLYEDNREKLLLSWMMAQQAERNIEIKLSNNYGADVVGHINIIHPERLQVMGQAEYDWAFRIGERRFAQMFLDLLAALPPAVIVADGLTPPDILIDACKQTNTPLLLSPKPCSAVIDLLRIYLSARLADTVNLHGVFMDVLGMGVLITGDSGVGKSELALELISRGHGLVADDVVEMARIAPTTIEGRCPGMLRDFLEVRGLGLLNIRTIFGETASRRKMKLKLIVHLQKTVSAGDAPRLPLDAQTQEVLGVPVRKVVIPVAAGRNLAVLLEAAVRNTILQLRGIDSMQDFMDRQQRMMLDDDA